MDGCLRPIMMKPCQRIKITMQDWLSARIVAGADAPALYIYGDDGTPTAYTYRQLHHLSLRMMRYLQQNDIQSGQKVAALMTSDLVCVVLLHAIMRMGCVLIPLNTRLTTDELNWQLANTGVDALCYPPSQASKAGAISAQSSTKMLDLSSSLEQEASDTTYIPRSIHLDDVFLLVYTSGTTGHPKAVELTYGNVFYSAMASAYRLGTLPHDRWLCILPLYHVGGLSILIRACLYGIAVDLQSRFDVPVLDQTLQQHPISLISLVPTMLYRLLDETDPQRWQPTLRLILLGGAVASPDLIQRCIDLNLPVATTYGLSEAASQVATATPDHVRCKPGTVGKPLLFSSIRIVDENGQTQAAGQIGEVVVRGLTTMRGYYKNPQATAATLRDGDLYTGDMGYVDDDGDLFVVQRRSDLIVSGGENIYPAEVENILKQHVAVVDAAVVGLDDVEWGQRVSAAVVLRSDADIAADDLIIFCRQHLAGYKVPRFIHIVDDLPKTASGKIRRPDVVDLLKTATNQRSE